MEVVLGQTDDPGRSPPIAGILGRIEEVERDLAGVLTIENLEHRPRMEATILSALPSMTTGSRALSVAIAHLGSAGRLRVFRDPRLPLNHSPPSCQIPPIPA
jgi:hypothetical protein